MDALWLTAAVGLALMIANLRSPDGRREPADEATGTGRRRMLRAT
jgi:ferric-dicitrate binding protein FerR (iron transport regulator)